MARIGGNLSAFPISLSHNLRATAFSDIKTHMEHISLTHPDYKGGANVLPEQLSDWLAAGWVEVKPAKKATVKGDTE